MRKSIYRDDYRKVVELLAEIRRSKGVTQVEMAALLKKPQSYVSKYESGERRLDIIELIDILNVLGLELDQFYNLLLRKAA
jgi:transcriptional regulator with XRE-family HTH domain